MIPGIFDTENGALDSWERRQVTRVIETDGKQQQNRGTEEANG